MARIQRDFPQEEHSSLIALFSSYGSEPYQKEQERVLLCILSLAKGDVRQVEDFLCHAKKDYRNIIFWAEYPQESQLDTPEMINSLNKMLLKFGSHCKVTGNGDA